MKAELHQNSPKHRPVKIGLSRRKMARLKALNILRWPPGLRMMLFGIGM